MTAISNLSAQFSEMLREFKKRGELYHEADDATLTTNDLIDVLGVSKATLNRLRQRRSIHFRIRAPLYPKRFEPLSIRTSHYFERTIPRQIISFQYRLRSILCFR